MHFLLTVSFLITLGALLPQDLTVKQTFQTSAITLQTLSQFS